MEHFAVDDLVIKLMAKRKDYMHEMYTNYCEKIESFLGNFQPGESETICAYFKSIEEKKRQHQEKSKEKKKRACRSESSSSKRRKSMVVTFDDMSFSFGKDDLEQLTGQEKPVDPEVKSLLQKMNELFKQLGQASVNK
ncbi:uncharacterized protein NEMAJ01_1354 [Nematocida major]|uniref:uncharacterized protein n=1 Tax=Nematocida major TaxID=1912982 RepID=UPI002008E12D|nr:uncharacterized protein NEMAJ01_1354 [Nematocida major]KAH9386458.1 hypothetical protein NEMAJ01_1354 [Nematocida major]